MAENALEQLQKIIDDKSRPVTKTNVEDAYNKAKIACLKEGGGHEDLTKLEKLKSGQLEQIDKLEKALAQGTKAVTDTAKTQTKIIKIEQEQKSLSDAAKAAPKFATFPTGNGYVVKQLATPERISGEIDEKLKKYQQDLEKAGLNTPENKVILKEAMQEMAEAFIKNDYNLIDSMAILKNNLETFLHGLDDIYEKQGGKTVFATPLEMIINFSQYSQTNVVGADGKLNKENLKTFLQYNTSTFTTYLSGYRHYLDLEERKRKLLKGSTQPLTPEVSPQAPVMPPEEPVKPDATTDLPKVVAAAPPPPQTPKQAVSPPTETPKPETPAAASILEGFKAFLEVIGTFFGIDLLSWLGPKDKKTLDPEIIKLTENLRNFNETEKSALHDMLEALLAMDAFKTDSGKKNILTKLGILLADDKKTKGILSSRPPIKPWGDWLKEKLDSEESTKLAGSEQLTVQGIAEMFT